MKGEFLFAGYSFIYMLVPILTYFITNYFILKRFFPTQNKTGKLIIGLTIGSFIMMGYFLFSGWIHGMPNRVNPIEKALGSLIINLATPYVVVLDRLNVGITDLGEGVIGLFFAAGSFAFFALIQILIQIIFSKRFFGKPTSQVLFPIFLASIVSWIVSLMFSVIAHLLFQFLIRNVTI